MLLDRRGAEPAGAAGDQVLHGPDLSFQAPLLLLLSLQPGADGVG
jgi:hypothetical protein